MVRMQSAHRLAWPTAAAAALALCFWLALVTPTAAYSAGTEGGLLDPSGPWHTGGPYGAQGTALLPTMVRDIAASPAYAGDHTLFAAAATGIYRSMDGGETWAALATYGPTYGLAVSPGYTADHGIWATYRQIEGTGDATPENSVMRSFDGGDTWIRTAEGLPGVYEPFARLVAPSPAFAADGTLFTALSGQLLAAPEHGLLRSYDRGATWVDLGAPPGDPDIYAVAVTSAPGEGVVAHVATAQGAWHFRPACDQHIVNAGFEYGGGWHFPVTAYTAGYSSDRSRSGVRSAAIGIRSPADNRFAYSSAQQTVTIPSGAANVTLALWWYPLSGEGDLPDTETAASAAARQLQAEAGARGDTAGPNAPLAGDRQYVLLLDEQGTVVQRLLWTRRDHPQWQPQQFDLAAFGGRTLRLHLGVYNDGKGGVTAMYVDDVTLTACEAVSPTLCSVPGGAACRQYLPLLSSGP